MREILLVEEVEEEEEEEEGRGEGEMSEGNGVSFVGYSKATLRLISAVMMCCRRLGSFRVRSVSLMVRKRKMGQPRRG